MEGDIAQLSLTELVQMICMGMHDREIHVFDGAVEVGAITLRRGQIERCFAFGSWGEAALFKLLALRQGRYVVNALEPQAVRADREQLRGWQELLIDAARQQDELLREAVGHDSRSSRVVIPIRGRATLESTSAPKGDWIELELSDAAEEVASSRQPVTPRPEARVPDLTPLAPAVAIAGPEEPEFSRTMQDATSAYLRRDFERAAQLLERCLELRPSDKRTLQNLERINRRRTGK